MLIKVAELNSGLGTPSACNFIATVWRSPSFLDTNSRRRLRPPPTMVTGAGGDWGEELPLNYLNFVQRGHILTEERRI